MTTNTRAPLEERLDHLAMSFAEFSHSGATALQLEMFLRDHASSLVEFGEQVREEYVRADSEGDIPTPAQGIALARFLRPAFRGDARDAFATVARGGFDLPNGYIAVRLADGYQGGIDREGRTST